MKSQSKLSVIIIAALVVTFLFGTTACYNKQTSEDIEKKDIAVTQNETRFDDSTKSNDASFLTESAFINFHAIGLGQLGKDKSKSPEILVLSKMLIEDHTQAAQSLKNMADKKNISLPLSAEKNEDESINQLVKQKDNTFNSAYVGVVIQYHEDAITKFEAADSTTSDPEIKNYIATVLPSLKNHLEEAKKIQKGVK